MSRRLVGLLVSALAAVHGGCAANDEHGMPGADAAPATGSDADEGADARPARPGDPLVDLGDSFDGAELDPAWSSFRGDRISATVQGGALDLVLLRGHGGAGDSSLWYQADEGSLMYKMVDAGDFRVSARVRVRRVPPNGEQSPLPSVRLGGLMVRNGDAASPDYAFIVTGHNVTQVGPETKNTDDGVSDFVGAAAPDSDAELRICRRGEVLHMYQRPYSGGAWQPALMPPSPGTFEPLRRPDLAGRVQVGLIVYTNQATPDLHMLVDSIDFMTPDTLDDCSAP